LTHTLVTDSLVPDKSAAWRQWAERQSARCLFYPVFDSSQIRTNQLL